jgi:DNA-nicking Smr family endonuclease
MADKISDEERRLFRDAVTAVKPLKETRLPIVLHIEKETHQKTIAKKIVNKPRTAIQEKKAVFDFEENQPIIQGDSIIAYAKPGITLRRRAQLQQGKFSIDATLDLHEHTSDEAIHATDRFLTRCHHNGFQAVCIIHGKGIYSAENKPVIKNLLNNYLRQHPLVLAFHSAKNKQGGTGAMIVLLKKK